MMNDISSGLSGKDFSSGGGELDVKLAIMFWGIANKIYKEEYGHSFNGDFASDEQRQFRLRAHADVMCEVASLDGDSRDITPAEAIQFTEALLRSREYYNDHPDDALPSLNGMGMYYHDRDNSGYARSVQFKAAEIGFLKDYMAYFKKASENLGDDLECEVPGA